MQWFMLFFWFYVLSNIMQNILLTDIYFAIMLSRPEICIFLQFMYLHFMPILSEWKRDLAEDTSRALRDHFLRKLLWVVSDFCSNLHQFKPQWTAWLKSGLLQDFFFFFLVCLFQISLDEMKRKNELHGFLQWYNNITFSAIQRV